MRKYRLHTWARSNPKGGSEFGGGEGGYPADKISTMIRKDVSRGIRKFSQNSIILRGLYADAWQGFFSGRTP